MQHAARNPRISAGLLRILIPSIEVRILTGHPDFSLKIYIVTAIFRDLLAFLRFVLVSA
jgi:hypothetical protein